MKKAIVNLARLIVVGAKHCTFEEYEELLCWIRPKVYSGFCF